MIRITSRFLVPPGYSGISVGPFIVARNRRYFDSDRFVRHEMIHFFQQLELLLIGFWILYLIFFLIGLVRLRSWDKAYRNNPFEREAYDNDTEVNYLLRRPLFNWSRYVRPGRDH